MEIFYWQPTIEEAKNFETYEYVEYSMADGVESFYKKTLPSYCFMPQSNIELQRKSLEYFQKSNQEDLEVLTFEHKAFNEFYLKELDEITKGIRDNKKLQLIDKKNTATSRYFIDIRSGCGAVRDRHHEKYDKDYQGLHRDTPDVVEYRHGHTANGVWDMEDEDVQYLNKRCSELNGV